MLSYDIVTWTSTNTLDFFDLMNQIPFSCRSQSPRSLRLWICGRWRAGIAGSIPAGGVYVCLLWVLCVGRYRFLRRADHSSRGVLLSVVCLSVIVKTRQWGDPGPLRAVAPRKKENYCLSRKFKIYDSRNNISFSFYMYFNLMFLEGSGLKNTRISHNLQVEFPSNWDVILLLAFQNHMVPMSCYLLTLSNPLFCHTLYLCFMRFAQQTASIPLYRIMQLVFVMEATMFSVR